MLDVLAKQYTGWTTADSATIQSLLASKSCIPTSKGNLLLPSEAYLKSVTLFPDLPIVQLQSKAAVPTAFLKWMGVRSHVDLQVVFDRLADLNWDHVQLVRYLVTVRGQLSDLEMSRLRNTPLLPREEVDERSEAGDAPAKFVASKRRYRAGELFAPIESFRKLKLDLLFWPHRWFPDSDEGTVMVRIYRIADNTPSLLPSEQLLSTLGLQKVLLLPHLLQLASTAATPEIRTAALSHLIEHFAKYASQYVASSSPAYLPSTVGDDKLYKPTEIYSDVEVSMLGLPVLAPQWTAYAEMLGVRSAPVADALVAYLAKNPPSTPEMAIEIFGFLAKRTGAFQSGHLRRLQDVPFVPVLKASSSGDGCLQVVHLRPVEVYFSDAEEYE